MTKPYCVTFAGVPGSSKSIVAHYLSERFGLPIFSTDNIRFEVREDMRAADLNEPTVLAEYKRRRDERREWLLTNRRPFIMDGSIDRNWGTFKKQLEQAGFAWFVIDMELSRDFVAELFRSTSRPKSVEQLPDYMRQHQAFLDEFAADVGLRITDASFVHRTALAEEALQVFLGDKT